MLHLISIFAIVGLLAVLSPSVSAQGKSVSIHGPMRDVGKDNLPSHKIGPNDLLAISVYNAPELTRTVRVSSEGYIRLPMLTIKLRATDLMPSELEATIAEALTNAEILVDPIVAVTVAEYHSRPISVIGAVKKPTTFQAIGNITLLEALGHAQGLRIDAGPEIIITRTSSADSSIPLVRRISVRDLIDRARPDLNLPLVGGEEIRVPEVKMIYVTGNVKKPGMIPVHDSSPITVIKALSMSEGLTPYYQKTVYILRRDKTGTKREIPVRLNRILDRKEEDLALQPEDILYIPDNNRKRVALSIFEKSTVFATSTVSGVLARRR